MKVHMLNKPCNASEINYIIYKNMISLVSLIFIFPMLIGNAVSAEAVKKVIGQGPIVITSEKMTADNQANTALFERSVVARNAGTILYADRMLVYSDKGSGDVTRIDATGEVKMIKEKRVITSKEATYYAEGEKVIFNGDPKAVENGNVITGKKMTYLMNEDRFLVDDSKVFLPKGEKR
jgi:lipopolysaccharide export system protein LptA